MDGSFHAADGLRLSYRTVGSGPLLLCHPGGPGRASAYLEDLGGLDRTRTLVLFDARGTGASGRPEGDDGYAPDRLADDLDALRATLGLERADVLGHSFGGYIAQAWAARHPERVGRLVLVTTSVRLADNADEVARETAEIRASRSGEPWYAEAAEAAADMDYAPRFERARLERMLRPFWYGRWGEREQAHAASADGQVNPRASLRMRELSRDFDWPAVFGRLATLSAPVLAVAGALDPLTPPSASAALGTLPGGEVAVLDGVGHFPWVEAPEEFAATVEGFLARTA